MVDKAEKLSKELGKALDEATLRIIRSSGTTGDQIASIFDNVEADFLPRISEYPALVLEAKRRVTERKLSQFISENLPYESVLPLLERLRDLGFSTFEIRANHEIIFAKYCYKRDRKDEAKNILSNLLHDTIKELKIHNQIFYREIRQKVEALLVTLQ